MGVTQVQKGSAAHPKNTNCRRAAVIFELSRFQIYEYMSILELQQATPLRGKNNDHQWGYVKYLEMTDEEFRDWVLKRIDEFLKGDPEAPISAPAPDDEEIF